MAKKGEEKKNMKVYRKPKDKVKWTEIKCSLKLLRVIE